MSNEFMGAKVGYARKTRGMTQAQLAEAVDLSPNYIGLIERGVGNPSLNSILVIADVLVVNPDYFIGRGAKKEREPKCEEYEEIIKKEIKTFDMQQLLCLLDVIEILRKYTRGDEQING